MRVGQNDCILSGLVLCEDAENLKITMEGSDIMLEKVFKLRENHTTVKTEILAGITTFMTMA